MELFIKKMSDKYAINILNWKYEPPYDFYNNEINADSIKELIENSYYVLVDTHGEIFGFFCIGESAQVPLGSTVGAYPDGFIDIGLGMNPKFTGKGMGFAFFSYILNYVKEIHTPLPFRLTVATFNKRAIHLYEKLGFIKKQKFQFGTVEFVTMEKEQE